MLIGRFVPLLAALAVAGSLAGKRVAPAGPGTFRTDTPTFVVLLIVVIVIVAALTFFPALLLGPIVQGLTHPALLDAPRPDQTVARWSQSSSSRVIFGLAYPLATDRRRPGRLPEQGRRQPIERDGKVVGSRLIGQDFKRDAARRARARARPRLLPAPALGDRLHPATSPSSTTSGPNSRDLAPQLRRRTSTAYLELRAAATTPG